MFLFGRCGVNILLYSDNISLLTAILHSDNFFYLEAAFKDVMATGETALRTHFLHLLSHLLLREGKRTTSDKNASHKLAHLLDADNTREDETERMKDVASIRSETASEETTSFQGNGVDLCRILHGVYADDDKQTKDNYNDERKFCVLAFRNLLCISYKAKETAVEGMSYSMSWKPSWLCKELTEK